MRRVILDTCVLVSALRSKRGASYRLLKLVGRDRFEMSLSVALILEYESAAKRLTKSIGLSQADIDDILDYLCSVARRRRIHYLWRPFLRDPNDDMLVELAVESEADTIITHNLRDFGGIDRFGIKALTPQEFLREIGELP